MSERLITHSPLGIQFWDAVFNRPVAETIDVSAAPVTNPAREIRAVFTRQGIYMFPELPGLRHYTHPPPTPLAPPTGPPHPFRIKVRDPVGRFLPINFEVDVPVSGYHGLYRPGFHASPSDPSPRFYLFSSPRRQVTFGVAAVRAQLQEATTGRPAPYAYAEVDIDGRRYLGYADHRGTLAILFCYPPFEATTNNSSPPEIVAVEPQWDGTLTIAYRSKSPEQVEKGISLRDLRNQPPAGIISRTGSPAQTSLDIVLPFKQELILQTEGMDPADGPVLLIQPA